MPNIREKLEIEIRSVVRNMLRQSGAGGLDINVILPRVLNISLAEIGAKTGTIIVINDEDEIDHSWVITSRGSYKPKYSVFLDDVIKTGLAGYAIRSKKTQLVFDTTQDPRWAISPNLNNKPLPTAVVCVPMMIGSRVMGVMTIAKPGANTLNQEDVQTIEWISKEAAIPIENARLLNEAHRQLRMSETLTKAGRVINSSLNLNEIMQSMLTQMNELLNAEAVSIALVDEQTNELVYEVADGIGSNEIVGLRLPANSGISGWVMQYGQPAMANDIANDPRFVTRGDKRTGIKTHAMICVPLQARDNVFGTIQAVNPSMGAFRQMDVQLLVNLASFASSAIVNAKQFALIQAAEARYAELFEDNIDPIILSNVDGIILESNRRVAKFLGYKRDALIGSSVNRLHMTEIVEATRISLAENNDGYVNIFRSDVLTQDEREIAVEVHVKQTAIHDEIVLQWIYHDISKLVELENMRNDLTAMLFHDLQNPLSNIISSLELLGLELPEDSGPIALMMLDTANRSSQRLRHLIRSLLDVNQLEAGSPLYDLSYHSIYDMVDSLVDVTHTQMSRRHIAMVLHLDKQMPVVHVNKDMVERVLINLVDNAIKFSRMEQSITVHANLQNNGEMVRFAVSDEGPGIPEQFRESIFGKFYRAPDNTSKGIGLGLAFCRLAVEAHGGEIWVDEASSGGAQFNFTIPVKKKA